MKIIHYFLSGILVLIISGCSSKKVYVESYTNLDLPINKMKDVDININGSSEFQNILRNQFPIQIKNSFYFNENMNSNMRLEIVELDENKISTPSLKEYVSYYEIKDNKKRIDYIYKEKCLNTKYFLNSNVKLYDNNTLILNKNVSGQHIENICINNEQEVLHNIKERNLFHNLNRSHHNYYTPNFLNEDLYINEKDISVFKTNLIYNLSNSILNVLVPKLQKNIVVILKDLDIKLSSEDKDIFDDLVESSLESNGINQKRINYLINKYPNSYTLLFNAGLFYEQSNYYEEAIHYYELANDISPNMEASYRLSIVKSQSNFNKLLEF